VVACSLEFRLQHHRRQLKRQGGERLRGGGPVAELPRLARPDHEPPPVRRSSGAPDRDHPPGASIPSPPIRCRGNASQRNQHQPPHGVVGPDERDITTRNGGQSFYLRSVVLTPPFMGARDMFYPPGASKRSAYISSGREADKRRLF
jgi:hypothetical protein